MASENPSPTPDILTQEDELKAIDLQISNARSNRESYCNRLFENYKLRRCIFDHPDKKDDPDAFPWQGASDQKVYYIDKEIRKGKAQKVNALMKSRVMFEPQGNTSVDKAKMTEEFWHWMVHVKVQPRREANLLADCMEEKGLGFINVLWDVEFQEMEDTPARDQFSEEEQQAILNPQIMEEEVLPIIQSRYPDEKPEKIVEAIQKVRAGTPLEDITLKKIIYTKQQPAFIFCKPDSDIILPEYTSDLQDADWIARCHHYSKDSLIRDKYALKYDEATVDYILEHCFDANGNTKNSGSSPNSSGAIDALKTESDSQYGVTTIPGLLVIDFYKREYKKDGSCRIMVTTYCPSYMETALRKKFPLGYGHGKYPFVPFELEVTDRNIHSSRGKPQILEHIQNELKIQVDSRIDRSTMNTLPPVEHPLGSPPSEIGPGAYMGYVSKRGETGFMETVPETNGSIQIEQNLKAFGEDYYGNIDPGASASGSITPVSAEQRRQTGAGASVLQEYDLEGWLSGWQEVYSQGFALTQQFLSDKTWFRAVGDPNAQPIGVSKDDIQGEYDIYPILSIQDLNPQLAIEAAKQLKDAAMMDQTGILDAGVALVEWANRLNMKLAKRIIRPGAAAQQSEINEEEDDYTKIAAGVPRQVSPKANHQLRLQYLTESILTQPDVQQRLQSDKAFKGRIQAHVEQLQFQIQQRKNAAIGKMGAMVE